MVQVPLPLLSPGTGTSFHGTRTYHSGTIRMYVSTQIRSFYLICRVRTNSMLNKQINIQILRLKRDEV